MRGMINFPFIACAEIGLTRYKGNVVSAKDIEIVLSRALQRYYPWVVIGIAFLTVGVAFGTRNAFAVFLVALIGFRWSYPDLSGARR